MKMYKNPHSVLVVIFCYSTQRVLMLQRQDDPTFWQSVTGSLALSESPRETAIREVKEEVGIDIQSESLALFDCEERIAFEIFPISVINTHQMSLIVLNTGFARACRGKNTPFNRACCFSMATCRSGSDFD